MTKDKMTTFKDTKSDFDKYLGTQPAEAKEAEKPWTFLLKFNNEEEDLIKESFKKSTYKAMYEFLKDAVLTNQNYIKK